MKTLIRDLENGVLCIGFNRPERKNAINAEMYLELATQLTAADDDDAVRVIILHGSVSAFTAGNDISEFQAAGAAGSSPAPSPAGGFMKALVDGCKPVIAAVNGPAVGIGATMLLHCDLVYAGTNAMLSFPFVKLGLCPEFASTEILAARVGYQRAAALLLAAETCDARKAEVLGLVNEVLDPEEVLPRAKAVAARIAGFSPQAIAATRSLMRAEQIPSTLEQIAAENEHFRRLLLSPQAKSAFDAFKARA